MSFMKWEHNKAKTLLTDTTVDYDEDSKCFKLSGVVTEDGSKQFGVEKGIKYTLYIGG